MSKRDRDPARPRRAQAVSTVWQAPLGALGGIALAVLIALLTMPITGFAVLDGDALQHPGAAGFGPWSGLALATLTGLTAGASVVAVLVRDLLAGQPPSLTRSWGRTWSSLPHVLIMLVVLVCAAALAILASLPLAVAFAVRCAWLARTPATRGDALRGLWLVVPGAAALSLLLMVPVAWSALLGGQPLRPALTIALHQSWRGRLGVLLGLTGAGAVILGLTWTGAQYVDAPESWSGARQLLGLGVVELIVIGSALGWLGHRRNEPPTQRVPGAAYVRSARTGWWGTRRVGSVSIIAIVSLLVPLAPGLLLATAQATEAALSQLVVDPNAVLVVDTLDDTGTPGPDDCLDAAAPCGIRAALAQARQAAGVGGSPRVEFAVSGTIQLSDTLSVPSGIVVDAGTQQVTLDAHHDFRAVVVSMAQETEGASVTLRGLTVTGGRSVEGGAGLFSDSTRVRLEQMTFTDNVSGTSTPNQPNGGAVAVPYTSLTVIASTFSDNQAAAGVGGAVSAGTLRWENSTSVHDLGLFGSPEGGAIFAGSGGLVSHATIINGGGVAGSETGGQLTVVNSAVRASEANFACARITDPSTLGHPTGNVDAGGTCLGTTAPLAPVGELADNGGPTRTVALFPGSPAIGAADWTQCVATDQRGEPRDTATCDAGAFQTTATDIPTITVTIDRLPAEIRVGEPIELGARMTSPAPLPTGTVRFLDGADVVADRPVVDGVARAQLTRLPQGRRTLTAEFVPDNNNPTSTSAPIQILVRAPVRTTLVSSTPARLHDPVTVTVHVDGNFDEAGVAAPTGQVHFSSGTDTYDATLVGGQATWSLPALSFAQVEVAYDGDDAHLPDLISRSVTTDDVATTTTATVVKGTVAFGGEVVVDASVIDAAGPVRGHVKLVVDDDPVFVRDVLVGGNARLAASVSPGTHTAHLVYEPDIGWAGSQSAPFELVVTPADATVVLAPLGDRAYRPYDWMMLPAQITGAGRGGADVQLLDGDKVVAVATSGLDGGVEFHFWSSELNAGTHSLVAETVASPRIAEVRSPAVQFTVSKIDAEFYMPRVAPGVAGSPLGITVSTGQIGDLVGVVELRRDDDNTLLGSGSINGMSTVVSFVPVVSGTYGINVVFIPDAQHPVMRNYLTTVKHTTVTVELAYIPAPTVTWTDPALAGATFLTVDFGDTAPAPTGFVTLIDQVRGQIAYAPVENGKAVLDPGGSLGGVCLCSGLTVRYSGDETWRALTVFAPRVQIESWPSSIRLGDLPTTVMRGDTVRLSATVSSAFAVPDGEVVFIVDGIEQPGVALVSGVARLSYPASVAGDHTFSARYSPATGLYAPSRSLTSTVTVSTVAEPVMTLSPPIDGRPLVVGAQTEFTATATVGAWLIPLGSTVTVIDSQDSVVGTGTWEGAVRPSSTIRVTPTHGGPQAFRALFEFDGGRQGTSAPLNLVVSARTPLLVEPAFARAQVNTPFAVTVSMDLVALSKLGMDPQSIQVQLRNYQDPVGDPAILNAANNFRATIDVTPRTRTDLLLTAVTTGNAAAGLAYGQAPYVTVTVRGLMVVPTVSGPDTVVQGDTWNADVVVPNPYSNGQAPSGSALVKLTDDAGTVAATCLVFLPDTTCQVGTSGTSPGRYAATVTYSGDDLYEPITNFTDQVFVIRATSRIALLPATDPSTWMVGDKVSVRWNTHDPRAGADSVDATHPGRVYLSYREIGSVLCSTPATEGGCTFTVPDYQSSMADKGYWVTLQATYVPASPTPPAQTTINVRTPAHCRTVTATNAIYWRGAPGNLVEPVVSGATCSANGVDGYVEGTPITVTQRASVPANFTFGGFDLGTSVPADSDPDPEVLVFKLGNNAHVKATYDWAPRCATVTITDEAGHSLFGKGWRDPGRLDLETPSNCSGGDWGESVTERTDRWKGVGHYIVGTTVQFSSHTSYSAGTVEDPSYDLVDIPRTLEADATHPLPYLTVASDVSIYPRWRASAKMCTKVRMLAGPGGTLALTKATVPSTYLYPEPGGACTTASGEAGVLAGTKVELTATPSSTGPEAPFVDRWWTEADFVLADFSRANPVAGVLPRTLNKRAVGTAQPSVPVTRGETVPQMNSEGLGARFGVGFAQVDCVPVAVEVYLPGSHGPGPKSSWPQSNCAARTSAPTPVETRVPRTGRVASVTDSRVDTTTMWYVRGTDIEVKLNAAWRPYAAWEGNSPTPYTLAPVWSASPAATFNDAITPTSRISDGVSRVMMTASRPLWLRAVYTPTGCGIPKVGSQFRWTWDVAKSSGLCPDDQVDPNQLVVLRAEPRTHQVPVWSTSWASRPGTVITPRRTSAKGTAYVGESLTYDEAGPEHVGRIGLTYCTPLNVTVQPVTAAGLPMSEADLAAVASVGPGWTGDPFSYLGDEGACPASLMGLPDTSQRVGLTDAANQKWVRLSATLNGQAVADGTNPSMRVSADATTTDKATFRLTPLCFELEWSSWVDVDTAPNCSGHASGRWFVAGTAVAVRYDGDKDREFDRWDGVDAAEGGNAVVIMNSNRKPIAHWDNLSIWEQAGNFFSSLAQRTLTALTTAAMAVAGKVLLVGTIASLVMGGIATGLEAVGLGGAVADGIRTGSKVTQAAIDMASATTLCVGEWATGGASPLVPNPVNIATSAVGGAGAVGGMAANKLNPTSTDANVAGAAKTGAKAVAVAINLTNAFGAGSDAYFSDARDAWSSIGDIGTCLEPAVAKVVDAA